MPAAIHLTTAERLNLQNFMSLPPKLRDLETRSMYISPDGQVFDLSGPQAGRQGVRLAQQIQGEHTWPFELVTTEGAYVYGADIERVNVNARRINLGVAIGRHNPPMNNYQFRMAEEHWWAGQDENRDGWFGVRSRFSGWRWIPVRPERTVETAQAYDPTRHGNNFVQWDINWLAARPYYSMPTLSETWKANTPGNVIFDSALNMYTGVIRLANRGDLPTHVKCVISSGGQAMIQDNHSTRMVKLPTNSIANDGASYMVDTEPGKRVLTAAKDPVDNIFYQIERSSKILGFFLNDIGDLGLPMQLRFQNRFMFSVPPRTVLNLKVAHESETGSITAYLPQRYKRSR